MYFQWSWPLHEYKDLMSSEIQISAIRKKTSEKLKIKTNNIFQIKRRIYMHAKYCTKPIDRVTGTSLCVDKYNNLVNIKTNNEPPRGIIQ